jgi:hypothetical protein
VCWGLLPDLFNADPDNNAPQFQEDEDGSDEEGGEVRAPRLTCQWAHVAPVAPTPCSDELISRNATESVLVRDSPLSEGLSAECRSVQRCGIVGVWD